MSYKVWVGYEMGIKENGLLLQPGPANVLNNGQTILAQIYIYIYIYIYINSRTAPIKLPLIAHGHVPLIYYLLSKGIVGTSNMLILDFLDVTSLGCLCPKPAVCKCSSIKWIERSTKYIPLTQNTSILCMYVCLYITAFASISRTAFEIKALSFAVNQFRKRTNEHSLHK